MLTVPIENFILPNKTVGLTKYQEIKCVVSSGFRPKTLYLGGSLSDEMPKIVLIFW